MKLAHQAICIKIAHKPMRYPNQTEYRIAFAPKEVEIKSLEMRVGAIALSPRKYLSKEESGNLRG